MKGKEAGQENWDGKSPLSWEHCWPCWEWSSRVCTENSKVNLQPKKLEDPVWQGGRSWKPLDFWQTMQAMHCSLEFQTQNIHWIRIICYDMSAIRHMVELDHFSDTCTSTLLGTWRRKHLVAMNMLCCGPATSTELWNYTTLQLP